MFRKYIHVERLGSSVVEQILYEGTSYVFPKIDGSNGVVWFENGEVKAGSRTRELTEKEDNHGFYKYVMQNQELQDLVCHNPHLILYGEWLVPHSIKGYHDDAWKKFYIFDIYDTKIEKFIPYSEYENDLEGLCIPHIECIGKIEIGDVNVQIDNFMQKANFLLKEGFHAEGVVIKNYDFKDRSGSSVWAKVINPRFENKVRAKKIENDDDIEQKVADELCTEHFIKKEVAKIVNEVGIWDKKLIPRVLGTVYYEFIKDNIWDIVKKNKHPTIDFKTLNACIKEKVLAIVLLM